MPRESAAMPIRPASSVLRKLTKPSPRRPSMFSRGIRASWKWSSRVSLARQPIFSSFFPALTPATLGSSSACPTPRARHCSRSTVSLVTIKLVIPRCPGPGSVRAVTEKISPTPAWVMSDLAPFRTKHSPCSTAVVAVPPASLPAPGRGGRAPGVAPGAGRGEPEPAHHPPRGEQRHVGLPLRLGAELEDRRGAEVGVRRDGERVGGVHLPHLVNGDVVGELVHPRAAVFLRPGNAQQAELAHPLDVLPRERAAAVELARDRRHVVAGELADHLPHLEMLLAEIEGVVHSANISLTPNPQNRSAAARREIGRASCRER